MLPLPEFQYLSPASLEEAVTLLAEHGEKARLVAGGTDLVPNLKHRLFEPDYLIGLSGLRDLEYIEETDDGGLRLGAMNRLADIRDSELVQQKATVLAEAAGQVAGPQIQNMGTLGGNICLDTRCVYYNQTHFWRESLGYCLKKDGTVCHVVQGGQNCVAAASSDTSPALICLDAEVVLVSARGERTVPIANLFKHPGDDYLRMEEDEILSEVRIPPQPDGLKSGYDKLRVRKSIDFPIFSVGCALTTNDNNQVTHFRMAATAMGSTPRNLNRFEKKVLGKELNDELIQTIAENARKRCVPLKNINVDTDWRRKMIPVVVARLLNSL